MRKRALPLIAAVLLVVIAPIQCRRAAGTGEDPLDREALDALVAYLRIDTSNPPGNESAGAKFLQQLLAKNGIPAQLVGADARRQGVYARLRSGTNEKALLLLSHIDVVPANDGWTKPPFGGLIENGYVWGRGALDIKSLAIAQAMAVIALKRQNAKLTRDMVFLATPDEEMGGVHGTKALLESRPDLFANVGAVLNEGGYNETVVDRVTFWGIEVQQKTPLWLRVHANGAAGHAASPPDDGGSVAKLVRALDAISKIETPYRVTPDVAQYFHDSGAARSDERGEVMRNIENELAGDRVKRVLPPGLRALLHDTITLTHVAAGTSTNSIPANATADVDIRLLPDETSAPMVQRVRDAIGKDAEVEVLLTNEPVPATSSDTDLFRLLETRMKDDEPGSRAAAIVGAGTTDSRYFRARGITAYGIAPFKVNYYDAGTIHGTDERMRSRFFAEGTRLVRRIVADYCSTSK